MVDFRDISYLKKGIRIQKAAYACLTNLKIFDTLKNFNPILTGSIPIKINTDFSDLDIICCVMNFDVFNKTVIHNYAFLPYFQSYRIENQFSFCFNFHKFKIEIYAENKDVFKQNAYIHMITEYRLLQLSGQKFRSDIIKLKKQGFKTEPAFGKLLGLNSPYDQLFNLHNVENNILFNLLGNYAK